MEWRTLKRDQNTIIHRWYRLNLLWECSNWNRINHSIIFRTMTVRFLRDVECVVLEYWTCGDKCCSGYEENGTDFFKAGDEAEDGYTVNVRNLEEGIDYEYID